MREIDFLIDSDAVMKELAEISDIIDEDTNLYMQDEFTYAADMTMLSEQDFEIPEIGAGPADSISGAYDNYNENPETDITTGKEEGFQEFGEKESYDGFTIEEEDFSDINLDDIGDTDQPDLPQSYTQDDFF